MPSTSDSLSLDGRFSVTVQDRTYEILLDDGTLTVDDELVPYRFKRISPHAYLLIIDGKPFPLFLQRNPQTGALTVTVRDQALSVDVKDEKDLLLEEFGLDEGPLEGVGQIMSPMPGLVLSIKVNEDDEVEAGQGLIVLEAMKMENELKAPSSGTVSAINVSEGDAVEKDAVLIEIQ